MKFKTNAKCAGCTSAITKALSPLAPASDWSFDLSSPDKTLTYVGAAPGPAEEEVITAIRNAGFKAEPLR